MVKLNDDIKKFIKDTVERALKTFCQALVAAIGTEQATLGNVNWTTALSTATLATLISVLMSIGSRQVGDNTTASIIK